VKRINVILKSALLGFVLRAVIYYTTGFILRTKKTKTCDCFLYVIKSD